MKTPIGFWLCIVALCSLPVVHTGAQDKNGRLDNFPNPRFTLHVPGQPISDRAARYRIPGKKVSQYSAEDWGAWIDSTWGPGQTAEEQLNIFDTFWTLVDQYWGGFPNIALNWDSLRTVYRPQIGSGLSRGRFYSLMSRMRIALLEHHSYISDETVDATFGAGSTWQYKSGIPLLFVGSGCLDLLGAPVTPMPDSSGVVYRIAPGNPLGLEPGDLVLGYDGIPWKRLYAQLVDYGVPVAHNYWYMVGSTPESNTHIILSAVGWNWGMFDTIDIVKYSSGDTLHLSTSPLEGYTPTVWATGQVPIAGVPMPPGAGGVGSPSVSWGVVQNTNIGYVYVWDWWTSQTPKFFHDAIYDLRYNKKVEGLIIDFRMNWGGDGTYANDGFAHLFGSDPSANISIARRNSINDHLSFSFYEPIYNRFIPSGPLFDRPIAVLLGPACLSAGDYNAYRMRCHPMARSFGKPTNGAFAGGDYLAGSLNAGWQYQVPTSIAFSNVSGEGYLIHKGVQPDEEVWLTRDGVARGEDDVVKRALQWMNTLSHAHDVVVIKDNVTITPAAKGVMYAASDTLYTIDTQTGAATQIGWIGPTQMTSLAIRPSTREMYGASTSSSGTVLYRVSASPASRLTAGNLADNIRITAKVENPEQHALVVSAIITNAQGSLIDSVVFTNTPGDSVWRAVISTPSIRGTYDVSVRTEDATAGTYRRLPNAASFTAAPTQIACTMSIPNMRAVTFNHGDTLFGATLKGSLYRIDLATGDADSIGTTAGVAYSGLSFRPGNGELWAAVRPVLSGRDRIYKVNTVTGVATLVGATGGGRITPSIAFAADDVLYGLKTGSISDTLIRISTDNAAGTLVGLAGITRLSALAMLADTTSVAVDEPYATQRPMRFSLSQNYPNPFNPSTTIKYELPKSSVVRVSVFDMLGREVSVLVNERRDAGVHEVKFDASGLSSGVYFYRLQAGEFVQTRKLVLLH